MKLRELLKITGFQRINGDIDMNATCTPTTKSEEVTENSLLFITKRVGGGISVDITQLIAHPYAIVTDIDLNSDIPTIMVENAREALSIAYSLYYNIDFDKTKFVGVTGTNGKTTTTTIIYKILRNLGIKCGLIGTGHIISNDRVITGNEYSMTTPDPSLLYSSVRQMQDDGCEIIVMEVSSHAISLGKIVGLKFSIGVFTNLSPEHLDYHASMEDYYKTKLNLFTICEKSIFNIDDEYCKRGYEEHTGEKISVGIVSRGDIFATDIKIDGLVGSEFLYRRDGLIFKAKTNLPGAFNIYNSLLALSVVIELGIKPCAAKVALKGIHTIQGRMEKIHEQPTVLIDYAHTPQAMYNALKTINSTLVLGQKLFLIFGCGGERDRSKRHIMGEYAVKYSDYTIITEDNNRSEPFENISADIISKISNSPRYEIIPNRADAIRTALSLASNNDVVAILGKGHEQYIIDTAGKHEFNEKKIVEDFYKIRNEN